MNKEGYYVHKISIGSFETTREINTMYQYL